MEELRRFISCVLSVCFDLLVTFWGLRLSKGCRDGSVCQRNELHLSSGYCEDSQPIEIEWHYQAMKLGEVISQ